MTRDEPWRRFTPFDHPPPRGITHDLSPPYCSKKARASERMSASLSFSTVFTSVRCCNSSNVAERRRALRRDMSTYAHIIAVFFKFSIFTKHSRAFLPHCRSPPYQFISTGQATQRNELEEYMYNKKSDYAINKRNPDAIIYTDPRKTKSSWPVMTLQAKKNFSIGKHGRMPSISKPKKMDAAITITPSRSSTMLIHTAKPLKMN